MPSGTVQSIASRFLGENILRVHYQKLRNLSFCLIKEAFKNSNMGARYDLSKIGSPVCGVPSFSLQSIPATMGLTQRKQGRKGRKSSGSPGSISKKSDHDRTRQALKALALKRREAAVGKREASVAEHEGAIAAGKSELQRHVKDLDAERSKLKEMVAEATQKARAIQEDAKANLASAYALREVMRKALEDVIVMDEDATRVASELSKQRAPCKKVAKHEQTAAEKARDTLRCRNGQLCDDTQSRNILLTYFNLMLEGRSANQAVSETAKIFTTSKNRVLEVRLVQC